MENGKELKSYRGLLAWQRGMDLVELVYASTRSWPKEELYGLTSQIRRAVVSIPSNIAEGQGRNGIKEFMHHLSIAHGSLAELETQALVAQRLGYLPPDTVNHLLDCASEVGRLINGLSRSLANKHTDDQRLTSTN